MATPNANIEFDHFFPEEIESLLQTKQDYADGKTTDIDWNDIESDLNKIYDYKTIHIFSIGEITNKHHHEPTCSSV